MPILTIPDPTFQRLTERAAALNMTVEELVAPILKDLAATGTSSATPDDWQRNFDAWMKEIEGRAGRYPPGFELDDSRASIYEGRGE
jgi:hypothetical protein